MAWRKVSVASAVIAVAACATPAVSAGALTPSPLPLPGSSFQGADGDQANSQMFIDWAGLGAGRVVRNHDPNDLDTQFAGGTKEGDPAHWRFNTKADGVTPGKDNILDAWSAVDQPSGRTFLYLAYSRNAPSGDTFLTFELNRIGGTWRNAEGVRVPCRREGDILVTYEISGNTADVYLRRWHTGTTDLASGCDRTGSIEASGAVTDNVEAQGAINPAPIDNVLGGPATIPAFRFGEAALDLDALLGPEFAHGCYAFSSIWMHSRSSTSYTSQMQDYVAPKAIDLRTCAAEGTKFFDLNANGVRDANDPGIPGFEIFADYDNDGKLDPGEPSTVSDSDGRYVLDDIHGSSYRLRERLVLPGRRATNDWRCSFPNAGTGGGFGGPGPLTCGWGPIDSRAEPNAKGRDFGNWYPAQLTVTKKLVPASDPGRFDLFVNDDLVFGDAEDGSSVTLSVPPGNYTASEQAVPPTDPSQYTSSVSCKRLARRARTGAGTIALAAGGRATCDFLNVRIGHPAIAIDKSGPSIAQAGDTLHYTLRVTNPSSVPFPEDQVDVSDPGCDSAPKLADKSDGSGQDGSPGTLDPGDTWTYTCSRKTAEPGEDCELRTVSNTATVSGSVGGETVNDSSTIITTLTCPDTPPPEPPDPPDPPVPPDPPDPPVPPQPPNPIAPTPVVPGQSEVPGAVVPPTPRPPKAGRGGVAGARATRLARCVTKLGRITLRGSNIDRVAVYLDGRLVRVVHARTLQRRMKIRRLGDVAAGTHRVTLRVHFRLGSGTRPIKLVRRVRICAALLPRFTG